MHQFFASVSGYIGAAFVTAAVLGTWWFNRTKPSVEDEGNGQYPSPKESGSPTRKPTFPDGPDIVSEDD